MPHAGRSYLMPIVLIATFMSAPDFAAGQSSLDLQLRFQTESSPDSGRFHQLTRGEKWKASETAIIVCDVWDLHHCLNAVRRLEEFAPRLNQVLVNARKRGVTIVHSPSDCMPAYENHPARKRALAAPMASNLPHDVDSWCSLIPAEERAVYPIDQSDGGEDDDPAEHQAWVAKLKKQGRNPGAPWKRQSKLIQIDKELDFISDRGGEVWNVLKSHGIRNVILAGVHTNMCVLGRPFGLRQMARNGMNVVLMRDMTDTMYNPKRWPYVSHFSGTDLVISHVERYVCPTISSDQILGGVEFRFAADQRPRLAMLIAEDEYETNLTLPAFAASELARDFRVLTIFGSDAERNHLPGLAALDQADLLLVSIRRRVLADKDMQRIRDFVASGKPIIGVRTASHAFSLRNKKPPQGFEDWPEFDQEVFGGNYHGHHGNSLHPTVYAVGPGREHQISSHMADSRFVSSGSLYQVSPLEKGAKVLMEAAIEGQPPEPVLWTFVRKNGGASLYTSLGHKDDFANSKFRRSLRNAIYHLAELALPQHEAETPVIEDYRRHWTLMHSPGSWEENSRGVLENYDGVGWYRCVVRIPSDWADQQMFIELGKSDDEASVWCNGKQLKSSRDSSRFPIPSSTVFANDANLLVVRVRDDGGPGGLVIAPRLAAGSQNVALAGRWQFRIAGEDEQFANMPLPAKFGAPTDIVFAPAEPLWTARPLTKPAEFTGGIEGPACDAQGMLYAVNFSKQGTVGRVRPDGVCELFVALPEKSIGNGIRFSRDGKHFFVADYTQHNVLKVNLKSRKITTYAHHDGMNQPNDLAIAPNGVLYASDPAWAKGDGQLWRIDEDGKVTQLAKQMGTTNGIEVSPDGKTLYVNESVQRNIWAFSIQADGSIKNKRLIRKFEDFGFDGMRCDADGNLYVTRHGKGTVVKMTPEGKVLREIAVLGALPTNICFGGPDGRTAYVTEAEHKRIVTFRVDRPGRSWSEMKNAR